MSLKSLKKRWAGELISTKCCCLV